MSWFEKYPNHRTSPSIQATYPLHAITWTIPTLHHAHIKWAFRGCGGHLTNLHISEAHRNEGISLFLHQSVLLLCLQPLFVSPPLLSFSLPFSPNWWICGVVKTHANETAGITQTMWPVKVGVGSKTRCSREPSLHTCTHTLPHSLPGIIPPPPPCHLFVLSFFFFFIWKKKGSGDDNQTKSGIPYLIYVLP